MISAKQILYNNQGSTWESNNFVSKFTSEPSLIYEVYFSSILIGWGEL